MCQIAVSAELRRTAAAVCLIDTLLLDSSVVFRAFFCNWKRNTVRLSLLSCGAISDENAAWTDSLSRNVGSQLPTYTA